MTVNKISIFLILGVMALLFCQFCSTEPVIDLKWKNKLMEERKQKDQEFKTSPTSPMAGVERFKLEKGEKSYVKGNPGKVSIVNEKEEGTKFLISDNEGQWQWEAIGEGVSCSYKGQPVEPGVNLPGKATFKVGQFTMVAYPAKDQLTLIVFDPERPQIKKFSQLLYFPANPKFSVETTVEKFEKLEEVKMLTSRNLEKVFVKYARLKFKLDGKEYALTAFKSKSHKEEPYLFIPFSDATTGKETYGVGRFLEIDEPAAAKFVLDFNRCFNPLCNYAPVYNCPMPPLENNLEVAIEAGEKTYPHH